MKVKPNNLVFFLLSNIPYFAMMITICFVMFVNMYCQFLNTLNTKTSAYWILSYFFEDQDF